MISECAPKSVYKEIESPLTQRTTIDTTVSGKTKGHVLIRGSKLTRITVIIISPCDNAAVDLDHDIPINGAIVGKRGDPLIGQFGCSGLSLSPCDQLVR